MKNINNIHLSILFLLFLIQTFTHGCEKQDNNTKSVSNSEELIKELNSAKVGTKIVLDIGEYEGSFNIPAGIILKGTDTKGVTLKSNNDKPVIVVNTSNPITEIENITIKAGKSGGIRADGKGKLKLKNINVTTTGLYGIAVLNLIDFNAEHI